MSQLPLIEIADVTDQKPVQVPKKGKGLRFYLLTAVLIVDGGLSYGGYEWHEKYIAQLPEYLFDQENMLKELIKIHQFSKGVIVQTGAGKRLKIGDAEIFFTKIMIPPTLARDMLENKILPLVTIKNTEAQAA